MWLGSGNLGDRASPAFNGGKGALSLALSPLGRDPGAGTKDPVLMLTPAMGGLCGLRELALELHLPPLRCSLFQLSQPLTPPFLLPQEGSALGSQIRPAKGAPALSFPPHSQACNVLFRGHGASVEIDIDGTSQHLLTLPFCWAARPPGPPPHLSRPSVSPLSREYP